MKFRFNTSRHPIILLALIGSALMLVRVLDNLEKEFSKPQATADAKTADFVVQGASYQKFDTQGKLANQFQARAVNYFGNTEKGTITEPVIDIYAQRPEENSWHITANHAALDAQKKLIQLTDNVELQRLASPTTEALTLKTSSLDINTETQTMHNDVPVSLASPSGNVEGIGIDGSLRDGQYKIRNRVKMTIQPQTTKPAD